MNGAIKIMSQKERYVQFRSYAESIKKELCLASNSEDVDKILSRLAKFMQQSAQDCQLEKLYGWILDVRGVISSVRTHDSTRTELNKLIEEMLASVDSLIARETEQELVEKTRKMFLLFAENSEKICKIIDMSKFFG